MAELAELASVGGLRELHSLTHQGREVADSTGRRMVNLSSNDYLLLAGDDALRAEFFEFFSGNFTQCAPLGSGSSRLLSGNSTVHEELEGVLHRLYGRAALTFSTGYGMNSGILPAITTKRSLILADKSVHASLIDGIRLSVARSIRFAHQDFEQLADLLNKYAGDYEEVVVVVESLYSMDGDMADLGRLVELKKKYSNVVLYVDEAHAVGVYGAEGLGLAQQAGVMGDIDYLCATFGKALGSVGAYVVCSEVAKEYLVNRCRTLIYNTALPPISAQWSAFLLGKLQALHPEREHLATVASLLREGLRSRGYESPSQSHIVPIITGDNASALALSRRLQEAGFYVLPIRTPTVAEGGQRIRISLNSKVSRAEIEQILSVL